MAYEDLVLDRDPLANKSVCRDLAAASDPGSFLNLDEGAYPRFVADLASVQVNEISDRHVPAKLDVFGNSAEQGILLHCR